MELGPFSWTGCRGQHAKRQCRSLTSLTPGMLGPPITAWLPCCCLPPLPVPRSPRSRQAVPGRQILWQGGALGMELLSWPATRVFALPWPCLLTQGPSYLPGVNAWGRENKPPLRLPAPLAVSWGGSGRWQLGQWQVGFLLAPAPWLVLPRSASCSWRLCGAASQLGWARHVADLGWEDRWVGGKPGSNFPSLAEAHP